MCKHNRQTKIISEGFYPSIFPSNCFWVHPLLHPRFIYIATHSRFTHLFLFLSLYLFYVQFYIFTHPLFYLLISTFTCLLIHFSSQIPHSPTYPLSSFIFSQVYYPLPIHFHPGYHPLPPNFPIDFPQPFPSPFPPTFPIHFHTIAPLLLSTFLITSDSTHSIHFTHPLSSSTSTQSHFVSSTITK